jgi:hypothetical protein
VTLWHVAVGKRNWIESVDEFDDVRAKNAPNECDSAMPVA